MKKRIVSNQTEPSSFRDPSAIVFYEKDSVLRDIRKSYKVHYEAFIKSGLYNVLLSQNLILPYEALKNHPGISDDSYIVLKQEKIPFISYPYEWSFGQLKDAALLTLGIQKKALEHDLTLKDASAYNIQFYNGSPVLIDISSFEMYEEGKPWVAYRQFCQHFLAPLLLICYNDIRLTQLLKTYIDGIPLDLASKLLPKSTYLNVSILSHIHLHAKNQQTYSSKHVKTSNMQFSLKKHALLGIIENLEGVIRGLEWKENKTEWGDYYTFTNYSDKSFENKKNIIERYIKKAKPESVWDMGGNTGEFSRIASDKGIFTISFDIDPLAVERNYQLIKKNKEKNLLPLLSDMTSPAPGIGWMNSERKSLVSRGPAEMVMALALVHHIAISNNVPFAMIAEFFYTITSKYVVVEFIPKKDSQVQILLTTRKDIFTEYNKENFEKSFSEYFKIISRDEIGGSMRTLYLMEKL